MGVHNIDEARRARQSVDRSGGGGYDDGMEARVSKLEGIAQEVRDRLVRIELKQDEFAKHYATKSDLADVKTSIVLWVVGSVFLAQLLPFVLKKFGL